MMEVWRDIPGYERHYQASSTGRIRSVKRAPRILKTGFRQGDAAEMCIIEFVDYNETYTVEKKKTASKTRRSRGKKTAQAAPAVEEAAAAVAPATESAAAEAPAAE